MMLLEDDADEVEKEISPGLAGKYSMWRNNSFPFYPQIAMKNYVFIHLSKNMKQKHDLLMIRNQN